MSFLRDSKRWVNNRNHDQKYYLSYENNGGNNQLFFYENDSPKIQLSFPKGTILPYGGSLSEIPYGWHLCDGSSGTPDLRDRFIVGAGKNYSLGNIGGENKHKLTIDEMPNHRHTYMWLNTKHQNNDSGSGYISEYDIYTDNIHVWNSFPYLYTTGVNKYNMSCTGGENPTCSLQETPIQPTLSMRYNRWIQRTSHAGEDKEHENRPPYYAVYYIMKIQ